jgi:hypothetical protein
MNYGEAEVNYGKAETNYEKAEGNYVKPEGNYDKFLSFRVLSGKYQFFRVVVDRPVAEFV